MQTTEDIVRSLSDTQVVEVTKELFNAVYTEIPYDDVRNNAKTVAEVGSLVAADQTTLMHELPATESAQRGRAVLEQYARDSGLAPFVEQAWEKVQKSDNLVVGVVLALGVVINLTLLVATTKFKMTRGPDGKITGEITKSEVGPELMKTVVDPVIDAVKSVGLA